MSEYKYTPDNRKIKIVNKLNDNQIIGYEVFIKSSNSEEYIGTTAIIFNVDELSDEPAMSWKEKRIKEIETHYEKELKRLNKNIESEISKTKEKLKNTKVRHKKIRELIDKIDNPTNKAAIDYLEDFLLNKITHFFVNDFHPKIVEFDEYFNETGAFSQDSMKLVSLFGNSNGELFYQVNTYGDGSGNWIDITPAKSYDEALEHAQTAFDDIQEEFLSSNNNNVVTRINNYLKIDGIYVKSETTDKLNNIAKAKIDKRIESLEEEIYQLQVRQKNYESISR